MSGGLAQFKLAFQVSPIILTGGIASNVPGGMIPIISLTQSQDFDTGLLSGSSDINLDDFFAHFNPIAGGTLIDLQVAHYPFANSQTAANATVAQPLRISLLMVAPARNAGDYSNKLSVMSSLQNSLNQHINQGGTFTVATPAFLYTDCVLTGLRDVTSGGGRQYQAQWQWDFEQPLLTLASAQSAQNSLMQKISNGTQTTGDPPSYSGAAASVGQPASGVAPSVVPAAQSTTGSSVAGPVSQNPAQSQ